ncbi:MAG: acyltransferase family protein [Prevotella sp.]
MKQRIYYLDNVCCFLIIHMIYTYHIAFICSIDDVQPTIISIVRTFFSFFMSWFFFKGGMTHRITSTMYIIKKGFNRLLIPYLFFLVLGVLLDWIIKSEQCPNISLVLFVKYEVGMILKNTIVNSTAASWFLLILYITRVLFNFLNSRIHPLYIAIVSLFSAYALFVMGNHGFGVYVNIKSIDTPIFFPPFYLGTICHGLVLYSFGYYIKEKQFKRNIFILAVLLFIFKFIFPSEIDFRINSTVEGNFLLAVLYGLSGCILINNIFMRYINRKITLISYIGSNSMVYYLVHYPVMMFIYLLYWESFINKDYWLKFTLLLLIVTLFMLIADIIFRNGKLRFIVGG